MYFKSVVRNNSTTGKLDGYYRLVESYRNADGRVCHRPLLTVGFMPEATPEQLNRIQSYLNLWQEQKETLFDDETDTYVSEKANEFWNRLVSEKRVDVNWKEKAERMIDADTIKHDNVREIGAEWIGYSAWEQLKLSDFRVTHFSWGLGKKFFQSEEEKLSILPHFLAVF